MTRRGGIINAARSWKEGKKFLWKEEHRARLSGGNPCFCKKYNQNLYPLVYFSKVGCPPPPKANWANTSKHLSVKIKLWSSQMRSSAAARISDTGLCL